MSIWILDLRWKACKHYTYILTCEVFISQSSPPHWDNINSQICGKWMTYMKKDNVKHSLIWSLIRQEFTEYCMQIIVLCSWNALANKVNLQSFVMITATMVMTITDIEIANNFIMLYMCQIMSCVLHTA